MDEYKITLTGTTGNTITYQLPIYLETNAHEMGIMVGFDGNINQMEQVCNFSYTGTGNTITIYNTLESNNITSFIGAEFRINWGDGSYDTLTIPEPYANVLPSITHVYSHTGTTIIELTVETPWKVQKISKNVVLPFVSSYDWPTDFGTIGISIPYESDLDPIEMDYLMDYRTLTGETNVTNISFLAIGKSRLNELKTYGTGNTYINGHNVGTGRTDNGEIYMGYSIDGLYYMDFEDGYTHITGSTSGTTEFVYGSNVIYDGMITRNEHLIGFIDEPQIYSDIFVERGKMGIMEMNLRLSEVDNVGELDIYGNGFFNVKKQ